MGLLLLVWEEPYRQRVYLDFYTVKNVFWRNAENFGITDFHDI